MEVKINREIRDYQETIFFGLGLRQLIFSILAIGVAVGVYFGLRDVLGTETVSWLCVLGAIPFGAMGFIRYNGMSAEQIAAAYIESEILMPKHLCFASENVYWLAMEEHVENARPAALFTAPAPQRRKQAAKKKRHTGGRRHDENRKSNL